MIDSFYTSSTAVINLKKGLDVTANNIANINTDGYKPFKASFSDLIYTDVRKNEYDGQLVMGHGVKLEKTDTINRQGSMKFTNRLLDFGITSNDGYFALMTQDGVKYTRNGNFNLTEIGENFYLSGTDGGLVLDSQGQPIIVKDINDQINPGVFTCENRDGLAREDGLFFVPTENSGEMTAIANPAVKRQCLEGSGVNLSDEMTNMLEAQRSFQFNSRIVQVADEIMQTINGLR